MAIVGTPGGGRITSMMLLATLAFINGADAQDMVSRLRFHHQYLPDEVQFETGGARTGGGAGLEGHGAYAA
jgi:gamma-glutamyltranspeptidase / glutathione hydrolase